jgi:hypothetical protein
MTALARMLLVATALLSSGVLQVATAMGHDPCCAAEQDAGERDASCPDCPPGLACSCCPVRGALQAAAPAIRPSALPGVPISVVAFEPSLGAPVTDIFQPPRA